MIVRFLNNTIPIITKGLATTYYSDVIVRADEEDAPLVSFNINDYDCCYEELALADLEEDTGWKNDKSSFLFQKSLATDVIEIKLFKCENGVDVEKAILNDNVLGQYFGLLYWGDELRVGYKLEWKKVMIAFGTGIYYIKTNREIINRESVLQTQNFRLLPYNEFIADKTVRIQTFSKGLIEGGIDYTGSEVEWEQMVRIRGKFWNPQTDFETDNYQDSNRNITQIQDQIVTDYDLILEGVPSTIGKPLIYDKLLANRILITDYNLFNYDRYRNYEVYPKEIIDSKFFSASGNALFSMKFTDKKQDIIKRNFL